MRILTLFTVMFFSLNLMANNGTPTNPTPVVEKPTSSIAFSKIFYSDYANTTLFIDFEALGNQFAELNILRDDKLMLEDNVTDLPSDTIYEIDLEVLRAGAYTLELKTPEGIKVIKEFVIN